VTVISAEASAKRCCTCGRRQPLDNFARSARRKDGLDPRCRSCCAAARHQSGSGAPPSPLASDPAPAQRLREELIIARQAGVSFEVAWPPALATALEAAGSPGEHEDWKIVLRGTRGSWEAAYNRTAALAGHASLAILAAAA
jgi:hypothetical protein